MTKENNNSNNNLLIVVIIILLIIIAVLAFIIWKWVWSNDWNNLNTWDNTTTNTDNLVNPIGDIKVSIIDDKRCTNCQTDALIAQLKQIPFMSNSELDVKDFSDSWIEDYLKDNWITMLPAVILSTNQVWDADMQQYLSPLKDWQYSLNIWANFDPFAERSEKWFLMLDKEVLSSIKSDSYLKWNSDAKITWLEYSDLECPYCAKLHNSTVESDLKAKYGDSINVYFNHFPLSFHENAMPWAIILECVWEQLWSDWFYWLIDVSYDEEKSNEDFLIDESVNLWADKDVLEACISDNKFKDKVENQMNNGSWIFWITWTPWNVLINNETWEYEVISWAYPTESFEAISDKLLSE